MGFGIYKNGVNYTIYKALVSQTGTNDPVVTEIENTTGSTFTFTRVAQGEYRIDISPALTDLNKVQVFISLGLASGNRTITFPITSLSSDRIDFTSTFNDGLGMGAFPEDNLLNSCSLMIIINK